MPLKPPLADIHAFLRTNRALIVHFSGTPRGVSSGFAHSYPLDLKNVVGGGAQGGLACSLVTPSDTLAGPGTRNALGCIGVVIGLKTADSLIAVAPGDAGSSVVNGIRRYPERDLTIQDCEDSIKKRIGHNEWGVRDYDVLGILAVDPYEIWDATPPGQTSYTDLFTVFAVFPNLPIFTFYGGRVTGMNINDLFYR